MVTDSSIGPILYKNKEDHRLYVGIRTDPDDGNWSEVVLNDTATIRFGLMVVKKGVMAKIKNLVQLK